MAETMPQGAAPTADEADTRLMAIIVYGLYLFGWPCLHLPTIVGLIMAYVKRDDARGTIWESHFANQIETFWISLVIGIAAIPLCFVFVGIPDSRGCVVVVPLPHDQGTDPRDRTQALRLA